MTTTWRIIDVCEVGHYGKPYRVILAVPSDGEASDGTLKAFLPIAVKYKVGDLLELAPAEASAP